MIIRSPKWLREFIDFELVFGEDIRGEKSKNQIRKERQRKKFEEERRLKRERRNIKKEWERRWNKTDRDMFCKFYCETFKNFSGENSVGHYTYTLYSSELNSIKETWQNDHMLWKKYDEWLNIEKNRLEEEKRKQEEQERLKNELNNLYDEWVKDWNSSKYSDKIKTETDIYGDIKAFYIFEDGREMTMKDNVLTIGSITYTLGLIFKNKFVEGFNRIINMEAYAERKPRHPKHNLYKTLLDTIKNRESQLEKLDFGDSKREILENELSNAKRKAKKMKEKYGF